MAKVVFYEIEEWEKDYIKERLPGHELDFYNEKLSKENVNAAKNADALGIFIYSEVSREMLDRMPNLKFIATMSTGFDHIDIKEARNRNIPVSNVPSYGENTVAEHTFALILALSRKIIESVERTKKGSFSLEGLRGFDLKGKTIGVIGTGRIGKHVIRMAKGFEMNILACDAYPSNDYAQQMGYKYVGLDELLANSDIITLHAPLTDQTHHMINCENIKKVRKGAILVNTARGGLIDTDCIISGLREKILSAVALDVLEEEYFIREEKQLISAEFLKTCDPKVILEEHMLIDQDNVIVTPHNAFNSKEALQRILDTSIENIRKFFEGSAVNVVN
jgi:D-lactate dehydrogenase